jgi:hypothetical protein
MGLLLPYIEEVAYAVAIADLQVELNRWARYLGVVPLDVTGKMDKKTSTFLAQIAVAYAPSVKQALAGFSSLPTNQERIAAIVETARILSVYGDSYEIDTIVVPPEQGTEIVIAAVEEANVELVAAGEEPISTAVVGGGMTTGAKIALVGGVFATVLLGGFLLSRRT